MLPVFTPNGLVAVLVKPDWRGVIAVEAPVASDGGWEAIAPKVPVIEHAPKDLVMQKDTNFLLVNQIEDRTLLIALHKRFDLLGGEVNLSRAVLRQGPLHCSKLGEEGDDFVIRVPLNQIRKHIVTHCELLHKGISPLLEPVALASVSETIGHSEPLCTVSTGAFARYSKVLAVEPAASIGAMVLACGFTLAFTAFYHY